MRDFTISVFRDLLKAFKKGDYQFQTYRDYIGSPSPRSLILRHDVDKLPLNSLKTAIIENELGIKGSYYFRALPCNFDEETIKNIAGLGHEIGYHYEDLALEHGKMDKAYESFCRNLDRLRKLVEVDTITMHGSPLSKWDNRGLWDHYDYRKLGLAGEPYLDMDFNQVAYFSDTGRRWNDSGNRIRDHVESRFTYSFKSTHDVINNINQLPDKAMFTFHPQRWSDNAVSWLHELFFQNIKNQVKKIIVKENLVIWDRHTRYPD